MASGCRSRDSVELLEIQHTPPHTPSPPGPCALQLHHAERPHPATPNFLCHLHMSSSQATANLSHVPDTAEGSRTLAKNQEWEMQEEEENPSEQCGVTSMGWAVMARMAVDNTDEMATFPGIGKGWEGRYKGKRKQGGCQSFISLTLPRAPCQPVSSGMWSLRGLHESTGAILSPGC